MEKIGVEAIVEGLSSFLGDMKKVDDSIAGVVPRTSLLGKAFTALGNVVDWLTGSVMRVLEYTLGNLIAGAIRAVISQINELISSTIEAGAQFQIMELRLQRLNFNEIVNSTGDYNKATQESVKLTREQLQWIQKLAVTTPYDAEAIANVYTLARSYQFTSKQAQGLTKDIADFAAGMGLGNTEIQRIIVNLGQMVQQQKVTGREMTDLARGAFVPVNDILKIMQEETGLTGAAFDDFKNSAEGVESFMRSFSKLVEDRFVGSTEQMARTFQGATDNAKDFFQSLIGFGIVRPVLGAVGGAVADFINELTSAQNWDRLTGSVEFFSSNLSAVVRDILGLAPSAQGLVDGIVQKFDEWGIWIAQHRQEIVQFFQNIGDTIKNKVVPFIRDELIPRMQEFGEVIRDKVIPFVRDDLIPAMLDFGKTVGEVITNKIIPFIENNLVPAFDKISAWVDENGPTIEEFFGALGNIVLGVISNLTGTEIDSSGITGFLDGIKGIMQFVIDNQDTITEWVTNFAKAAVIFGVVSSVLGILGNVIMGVVGFIATLLGAWLAVQAVISILTPVFTFLGAVIAGLNLPIILLVAAIGLVIWAFVEAFNFGRMLGQGLFDVFNGIIIPAAQNMATNVISSFVSLKDGAIASFNEMGENMKTWAFDIYTDLLAQFKLLTDHLRGLGWPRLGGDMMAGMARGIADRAEEVIKQIVRAVEQAIAAARALLASFSPSRVFMELGANTMEGMAIGIADNAKLASSAMRSAVAGVIAPAANAVAAPSTVSTVNNYTSNYNLSINTQAQAEPIVQDFNMMQSMAGAG